MRGSRSTEPADLKKKEERKTFGLFCEFLVWYFCDAFSRHWESCWSTIMKTLEGEWYVVIKAYKLAVFEILGDFFVLPYIACPRYPYIII